MTHTSKPAAVFSTMLAAASMFMLLIEPSWEAFGVTVFGIIVAALFVRDAIEELREQQRRRDKPEPQRQITEYTDGN